MESKLEKLKTEMTDMNYSCTAERTSLQEQIKSNKAFMSEVIVESVSDLEDYIKLNILPFIPINPSTYANNPRVQNPQSSGLLPTPGRPPSTSNRKKK